MAAAESGSGAYVDGERMTLEHMPLQTADLVASVHTRYLPETLRETVRSRLPRLGKVLRSQHCAGHDYPELIRGGHHFILYWKSLPWDHAPGALMVGRSRRERGECRHANEDQDDAGHLDAGEPFPEEHVAAHRGDGAAFKSLGNVLMTVSEFAIKAGANVIFLR